MARFHSIPVFRSFRRSVTWTLVLLLCNELFNATTGQENEIRRALGNVVAYPRTRDRVRKQRLFAEMPFPCGNASSSSTTGRSPRRPTSVHRLRPGDIDVIGAMGDSLVAGSGAMEEFALGTFIEYRGVSWCAGGERNWRQYLTLPNILKEFNPRLVGYSLGSGQFFEPNSQLNVAFPVSATADAYAQAKLLVSRIRAHPDIDLEQDWKMVTVFFGANDLCSGQCFNKTGASADQHRRKLMKALDYLQAHLPRTFVNLVPALDVSVSVRVRRSLSCRLLHRLFCACFHQGSDAEAMFTITQLVRDYQLAEQQLVLSGRYDKRKDFTVVIQPFIKMFNAPLERSERQKEAIDVSYITYDCFHFSQKGHALAANLVWNNLLQPVGRKSTVPVDHVMDEFRCPSPEAPFLFTKKNSETFEETGRQND